MDKPRYRVVPLGQLNAGDIFWSITSGRVLKGNKEYRTPREPFKGQVIYHTNGGMKVKILEGSTASRFGFEMHTSRERLVFVEVKA